MWDVGSLTEVSDVGGTADSTARSTMGRLLHVRRRAGLVGDGGVDLLEVAVLDFSGHDVVSDGAVKQAYQA